MPAAEPRTSNNLAVILERIEGIRCDVAKLVNDLAGYAKAQNDFRVEYEQRHAALEKKVQAADSKVDEHEKDLKELKEVVAKLDATVKALAFQAKIVSWVGTMFGASMIALIWAILTHQIILGVP
jgi:septal ring factor EnvC (AmiA/AmiB activator)